MESHTSELRKSAPEWSFAGDRNLLQALQDLHQKLMTKCQEVNTNLDDMVNKLDNASVDLQNVNNKFLALSNSQFIESRVYDEDITLEGEQEKKTNPPVSEEDELLKLKRSLQTFERMHEAVRILDSDSSDEEDDFSTILKPKDMYSERPLPYIIGSQKWETKWHVGLVPSESESDDSEENYFAKKQEPREQYSESESEDEGTYQKEATRVSSSSEAEWEPSPGPSARPADIAAQIARRLAAQVSSSSEAEWEPSPGPSARPADVAAQIARRLAAQVSSSSEAEWEPSPGPSARPADVAAQIARRLAAQVSSSSEAEWEPSPGPCARPADVAAQIARRLAAQVSSSSEAAWEPSPGPSARPADVAAQIARRLAAQVSSSSEAEWEPSPGPSARPADVAAQIARQLAAQVSSSSEAEWEQSARPADIAAQIARRLAAQVSSSSEAEWEPSPGPSARPADVAAQIARRLAAQVSSSSEAEWEPSPGPCARPADVAAQIARRLAAQEPALETEIESREPSIPDNGPRKVYRAEQPGTIPVFSEEPPPLDNSIDDYSDNYSDEDDVFAELHRKPSTHRQSDPRSVDPIVEKLFGDEILRNEKKQDEKVASSVDTSILLKNDSKANLLPQQNLSESTETNRKEQTIKKPIGGMSLFGSSQGAESIGAAILKRNQRKSSTSDDDDKPVGDNSQPHRIVNSVPPPANKIIEDLFTKPQATKKVPTIGKVTGVTSTHKSTPKPKIDLFSDNIFDDIDDTFTSGIVTKPKETKQKSIFDDDDLFADVITNTVAKDDKKKSIFDSDDELFKEDSIESTSISAKKTVTTKINETSRNKNTEASIFSDGNDSDDIFTSNNITPKIVQSRTTSETPDHTSAQSKNSNTVHSTNNVQSIDNEITVRHTQTLNKTLEPTLPKKFDSPLLFDEDDIDDLFTSNMNASKMRESKIGSNKDEHVFDNESVIKATKASKENNDKASEKQALKDTCLVVNNTESDKHLFNSPKSLEEVGYDKNTNDSILKVSNEKNRSEDKNFVTVDFKVEETKNISLGNEESLGDIKGTEKVTVTSDYLFNAPVNEENANNLSDSVTTESISTIIKHDQKQHDELEDLFSDIPPAFEKPSEPKKSKNVNALFDDDSDDEALFFRKSDVTDEKPKVSYDNNRFRIFHDEPPDVDVDFTTKTENALKTVDSDEDLFTLPKYNENSKNKPNTIDKDPSNVNTGHENIQQNDDLYTKKKDSVEIKKEESLDISKLLSSEIIETDSKLNSEISSTVNKPIPNIVSELNDKDTEINGKKSIGKLKPMNININVQSLLPGASPTKQKPKDESDGSTFSTQSNEELNKYSNEKEDSKMVKSVSFDGDPGSEVLDNKLSKGRAKIQVKRRPSSRRARLEAVRKSGIDLTDDSTDNSSSFDEPKPTSSDHDRSSEVKDVPVHTSTSDNVSTTTVNTVINNEITFSKKIDNLENNTTEVKSKTVYILHDEDIFSNSPNTKTDTTKKSLTILDDDDDEDLFKNPGATSAKTNKTLEKPKKDVNKNISKNSKILVPKATKSIFDDLSDDDELFGGKNSGESSSNVKSKDTNKVKQNVSSMKTGSLFGDDSDDEDLFKTARSTEVKATKPKEITTVKSTAVTNDPLSLFDDD